MMDSPLGADDNQPLICDHCGTTVMALVQIESRTGLQWWCYSCHIQERDRVEAE